MNTDQPREDLEDGYSAAIARIAARPPTALRRIAEDLPWPLAVIPPFVATLALPILALAFAFSVVASTTHVVQSTMRLSGRVEVHGMKAVTPDRAEVDFGVLGDHARSDATFSSRTRTRSRRGLSSP